jgi:hypothetical protein
VVLHILPVDASRLAFLDHVGKDVIHQLVEMQKAKNVSVQFFVIVIRVIRDCFFQSRQGF